MGRIALVVRTRAKPGHRESLQALWEEHLKQRILDTPAQETYFFCDDNGDADTFFLFEVYSDAAILARNAGSDWFTAYMKAAGGYIESVETMQGEPVWWKV